MNYQVEYTCEYEAVAAVHDMLYEYNLKHTGAERRDDVTAQTCDTTEALVIRDEDGNVCGGLVWHTEKEPVHYIRADYFVIGDQLRGQGAGGKIFEDFYDRAQKSGAEYIKLYTNSFQAPGFYQKQGMELESSHPAPLKNFPDNMSYNFIKYL